jgi:hypothetical protein
MAETLVFRLVFKSLWFTDYDLRDVHILAIQEVVGLETDNETIEVSEVRESLEINLVTYDIKQFFLMLLIAVLNCMKYRPNKNSPFPSREGDQDSKPLSF